MLESDSCSHKANKAVRGRPNFGFAFGAKCGQMGTFGRHSVSAESSRTTFGALSVLACCRRRESLALLCTDCKDNRGSWLRCLRLHLVLWQAGIHFQFQFSTESHTLLSVAHTVSAKCVTSLSAESKTSAIGRPLKAVSRTNHQQFTANWTIQLDRLTSNL